MASPEPVNLSGARVLSSLRQRVGTARYSIEWRAVSFANGNFYAARREYELVTPRSYDVQTKLRSPELSHSNSNPDLLPNPTQHVVFLQHPATGVLTQSGCLSGFAETNGDSGG